MQIFDLADIAVQVHIWNRDTKYIIHKILKHMRPTSFFPLPSERRYYSLLLRPCYQSTFFTIGNGPSVYPIDKELHTTDWSAMLCFNLPSLAVRIVFPSLRGMHGFQKGWKTFPIHDSS